MSLLIALKQLGIVGVGSVQSRWKRRASLWAAAVMAFEIASLRLLEGKLPPRALGLVVEWASQHQEELTANWDAVRNDTPPKKIPPLQ
jgi:hypothetical protein